ncbi:hypothetical protein PVK06_020204 [Gossypium arboreum]|uniref:Uncharacterized protein n=1 Tax=Gossypium arboreum TaxID=29729 RepID=A0ABR0PLS1_GOSAR|nr:hypothetical protein PVK06_020204 [Gossypium arboreum]
MIGAFQWIAGANCASAPANPTPVSRGLPLEHLLALGGKEFSRIKGTDLIRAEYWLEGVGKILEQMSCSDKEKLGCVVSLLDDKAHRWWNMVRIGIFF